MFQFFSVLSSPQLGHLPSFPNTNEFQITYVLIHKHWTYSKYYISSFRIHDNIPINTAQVNNLLEIYLKINLSPSLSLSWWSICLLAKYIIIKDSYRKEHQQIISNNRDYSLKNFIEEYNN